MYTYFTLIRWAPLALVLASPLWSWAQGSRADYERADALNELVRDKVFRDRVDPQWIEGSSRFWYRIEVAPGEHRFYRVDPLQGKREEAFDHALLAAGLSEVLETEVAEGALPLTNLEFREEAGGLAITFRAGGKALRYDPQGDVLTVEKREVSEAKDGAVRILPRVRPGESRGGSTEVTFINRTEGEVELFWVSGRETFVSYGRVKAGGMRSQHTYAGHVWWVRGAEGETLGVFQATEEPGEAVIDGSWKPGEEPEVKRETEEAKEAEKPRREGLSPDGRWRAEIEEHQVMITEMRTGERFRLTDSATEEDAFEGPFYWSPDGSRLVVMQVKRAEKRQVHVVESSPEDQLQPRLVTFDYVKPGDPLDHPRPRLFDVENRREIAVADTLFSCPWSLSELAWKGDSSAFHFLYNERGHQVFRLLAVDASSGEVRTVIEEAPETFVCYSSKVYYRWLEDRGEVLWMSERDGWNHLYLFDEGTGEVKRQLTRGSWVVRGVDRVDEEKREVWFRAGGMDPDEDPYHVHYCRVNLDDGSLVRLTSGDGTHAVTYSPDGLVLVDTYSRVDLPPVTEVRRADDGSWLMDLETADVSRLREAGWRAPERFVAKGRDGVTDIYGIIHRPTTFDSGKRYPVIEKIYAGPHSAHVRKDFSARGVAMAELGFIIVEIDGMGTSHRSKAFHDVCWQNLGDAGFPDRIAWIRAAAETRPWMDLTRVGIYGGSAGGQNAMRALIAHHDFYRVAVADCGCHDNRMDKIWWNEQWMGYPVGDHYEGSSNVAQAHRLEGKLLLIVGELDRNVDPASTMQVVDALVRADKDFELLVIPGAGHGAAGTPYGRRRQRDFLVRHLWGSEPRHVPPVSGGREDGEAVGVAR